MESATWRGRVVDILWVVVWGVASSAWCATAAGHLGATFDEPVYVQQGLERWRTGSSAGLMKLGTMPLPVDVQTLPLYLWERWRGTPIDPQRELHRVLPFARAATLLFWWLLLVHVGLAARSLGGRRAAFLAVAFTACEPVLAAHAGLATTDVAVSACLVALAYHFRRTRTARWGWRVGWPAVWFGLAVLAKASGLVFGGLILGLIEADCCGWWRRRPGEPAGPTLRSSLGDLLQIGALGMVLVFVWCGCDWRTNGSFQAWARGLPAGTTAAAMVWLSDHLRIFSNGGEGIVRQVTHNVRGHGVYLLGHTDPRSLWWYFPVLVTIKFSVPVLLAPLAWAGLRRGGARGGPWYGNWALLCALALLAFSLACRVQIGVRFMFPLLCFAVIGTAAGLARWAATPWRARLLAGGAAACLMWNISQAVAVWPDGLCYVNPLWGGTRDGYRLTSEANYDWGQGLTELAAWLRDHPQPDLELWYYGSDPLYTQMPVRPVGLLGLPAAGPEEARDYLRGRRVAVGTTVLYGSLSERGGLSYLVPVLRASRPVDRTTTFLIYDFTADPPRTGGHVAAK
jgi:hypothetical protein